MAFPADTSSFAAALMPTERWSVRRAQKDQELVYQQALLQQAAAERQQMQQQASALQQTEQAILSQPFLGKDRANLNQWWSKKKSDLANKIATDYKGDVRRFLDSEGTMYVQEIANEFVASDVFKSGRNNVQNLSLAQEALKKGEYVIGGYGGDGYYRSGLQLMSDFINGQSDGFQFRGSYKDVPTKQMIEHFGKMDNPYNKFDRTATVPRMEVENWIRGNATPEVAQDLIARGYADTPISYKRYSLQDENEYNADMLNKQMRYGLGMQQSALNQQRGLINQMKIDGKKQENAMFSGDAPWFDSYRGTSRGSVATEFKPDKNEDYTIRTLGVDLKSYDQGGKLPFTQVNVLTDTGKSYVRNKAGIGAKGGTAQEAILLKNGGHVLNLENIPHVVESVDGDIYLPNADKGNSGRRNRGDGFTKATIRIPKAGADALGLYNDHWWKLSDTDKGRGLYTEDPKTGDLIFKDAYIPLKGIYFDQEFNRLMLKNSMGQKAANDLMDSSGGVDFESFDI